jgi:hypothetical protein
VEGGPLSADPLTVHLDEILDSFAAAVVDATPASAAARIDRIARLEKLRAATAGLQIAESVRFAQSQVKEQMAAKVDPEAIGRGIAAADRAGLPDLPNGSGASVERRPSLVV